ncbi:hypothetical protein DXG01_004377 [Tephrocybe rancida]|nr:hypothetical protein DXG01_004377 [Tephrocybe rancida]
MSSALSSSPTSSSSGCSIYGNQEHAVVMQEQKALARAMCLKEEIHLHRGYKRCKLNQGRRGFEAEDPELDWSGYAQLEGESPKLAEEAHQDSPVCAGCVTLQIQIDDAVMERDITCAMLKLVHEKVVAFYKGAQSASMYMHLAARDLSSIGSWEF